MQRRDVDHAAVWALAFGAAASAGVATLAVLRRRRDRREESRIENELDALEVDVVEALRRDAVTGGCAIDVAVVSPGIVELSGTVPTREAAQRAARLLHAVAGVRTVVNRIEEGIVEQHLAGNRARRSVERTDAAIRADSTEQAPPAEHAARTNAADWTDSADLSASASAPLSTEDGMHM
jgi:hypothetical protein